MLKIEGAESGCFEGFGEPGEELRGHEILESTGRRTVGLKVVSA